MNDAVVVRRHKGESKGGKRERETATSGEKDGKKVAAEADESGREKEETSSRAVI